MIPGDFVWLVLVKGFAEECEVPGDAGLHLRALDPGEHGGGGRDSGPGLSILTLDHGTWNTETRMC